MTTTYYTPTGNPSAETRGNSSQVRAEFQSIASAFSSASTDIHTLSTYVNTTTAGGPYAIPYVIDLTSTADSDPGTGNLRFNSATQNASTVLRLDTMSGGVDYSSIIDSFDASSSTVKGSVRLVKYGDASKFLVFNVTARTAPSGYRNISVTLVGGSAANPFANGDSVLLFFQRTGDKGDIGVASFPSMHVREEQSAGTAAAAGTTISSTEYRRVLNTVKSNDISGASLSGNQVTLTAAGKYLMRARSTLSVTVGSGAVAGQKSAIYDTTAGAYVGTSMLGGVTASGTGNVTVPTPVSEAIAVVTTTGTKTFELRTLTSQTVATWGSVLNVGVPEVYTEFIIEKIG